AFRLRVKHAEDVDAGVVTHQREWDDHGLVFDFGEAESGDALAEDADDREGELTHSNSAADGIVEAEDAIGELLCNEADLAPRFHVGGIEVAAAKNDQTADILVAVGNADEVDGAFFRRDHDGHRQFARTGDLRDAWDGRLYGVHVLDRQLVAERLA